MTLSSEQIQGFANTVAGWRTQEYISIAFYCFYAYYILITMSEEVSVVHPQRWNRGKTLYMVIRYGLLAYIALSLCRDHRNHFILAPMGCKALLVTSEAIYWLVAVTCNLSLGICVGAILHAKVLRLIAILGLSCCFAFVDGVLELAGMIQYPAEPVSALPSELGYPCYTVSFKQRSEKTVAFAGLDIRSYVNLATTTMLALLGVYTLFVRYRGQGGRLAQVIRRLGGLHCMFLLSIRLCSAIMHTPGLVPTSTIDANPAYLIANVANEVVVSILAQRLLIDMRKVDYMGSQPFASKLLFAPPEPGSEDDLDSFETPSEPSGLRSSREAPGAGCSPCNRDR